jgi:hypothetical protein
MTIKGHLDKLNRLFQNYNSIPTLILDKNSYKSVLIAGFAKALEFNLFLYKNRSAKNSFFYSPFLRGLCEDLISLKYINKHFNSEKDSLVSNYMLYLLFNSMIAQKNFLGKESPNQQIVLFENIDRLVLEKESALKAIMLSKGFNKEKIFPSVEHMAIDSNLKPLYDFFYHATSRMVHFSPNILLRMGWYEKDGPTIFSSHNFYKYYEQFNRFYATYLLIEFCNSFKKEMAFNDSFLAEVKSIKSLLHENLFYPELVTFEEMNMKRPNEMFVRFLKELIKSNPEVDIKNDPDIKRIFGKDVNLEKILK